MEVSETAACGISQREFAIEFDEQDLVAFYRILVFAQKGSGFYDEDFLEDLRSQLSYIIGPSFEQAPDQDASEVVMAFENIGSAYALNFNEDSAKFLNQILVAVEDPGKDFDQKLNQKLIDHMLEMAPNILDNLTTINR